MAGSRVWPLSLLVNTTHWLGGLWIYVLTYSRSAGELFQVNRVSQVTASLGEQQDKKLPARSRGSPCCPSDQGVGRSKGANWAGSLARGSCWHVTEQRVQGSPCLPFSLQQGSSLCIGSKNRSVGPGHSRFAWMSYGFCAAFSCLATAKWFLVMQPVLLQWTSGRSTSNFWSPLFSVVCLCCFCHHPMSKILFIVQLIFVSLSQVPCSPSQPPVFYPEGLSIDTRCLEGQKSKSAGAAIACGSDFSQTEVADQHARTMQGQASSVQVWVQVLPLVLGGLGCMDSSLQSLLFVWPLNRKKKKRQMSVLSWWNKFSVFPCLNFCVSVTFLQGVGYLIYKMKGWWFCQERVLSWLAPQVWGLHIPFLRVSQGWDAAVLHEIK